MLEYLHRDVGPKHGIANKDQNDDRHDDANGPSHRFKQNEDQQGSENNIDRQRHTHAQNLLGNGIAEAEDIQIKAVPCHPDIQRGGHTNDNEQPVINWHTRQHSGDGWLIAALLQALERRKGNENQDNDARHVGAHMPVIHRHANASCHIMVKGKKNTEPKNKFCKPVADRAGL
jgi:hypothetical protein